MFFNDIYPISFSASAPGDCLRRESICRMHHYGIKPPCARPIALPATDMNPLVQLILAIGPADHPRIFQEPTADDLTGLSQNTKGNRGDIQRRDD